MQFDQSLRVPEGYEELIARYALVGSNLERANLKGMDLSGVNFSNANLRGADLSDSNLKGANFTKADLSRACLLRCDCEGADFTGADMSMAYLRAVNFSKARMWNTTMRRVTAKNSIFFDADLRGANMMQADFFGCRWNGANVEGVVNVDFAVFWWFIPVGWEGRVEYRQREGLVRLEKSVTGGFSYQENAARRYE